MLRAVGSSLPVEGSLERSKAIGAIAGKVLGSRVRTPRLRAVWTWNSTFRSQASALGWQPTLPAGFRHYRTSSRANKRRSKPIEEEPVRPDEQEVSDLVAPVNLPEDPDGVLQKSHPATAILGNSAIVIQRKIEMMNVFLGYEQANRYEIMDGKGATIGYLAEEDHGFGRAITRQLARTHRSFTAHVFDLQQREVLRIHRPFAYINSRIQIHDPITPGEYESKPSQDDKSSVSTEVASPDGPITSRLPLSEMRIIGEAQQQWALLRRKYNLFSLRPVPNEDEQCMAQFASIDAPFLSWDFELLTSSGAMIGSVSRNFSNIAREVFTDTGVYALRMDSVASPAVLPTSSSFSSSPYATTSQTQPVQVLGPALSLDHRAVMLATAVSIDFDYFSRQSGVLSSYFPIPLWVPGGAATTTATTEEVGAVGASAGSAAAGDAVAGAAAGAVGGPAARGAAGSAAEAGVVGAGTVAGYEAMQRGLGRGGQGAGVDDASPLAGNGDVGSTPGEGGGLPGDHQGGGSEEEVWGNGADPFDGAADGAGEGGGGLLDSITDFFS